MQPHTFIFTGRSGCGKGTQADLLKKHLADTMPLPQMYLEMGSLFREFIVRDGVTPALAREVQGRGGLQPSFLAVWLWSHFFAGLTDLNQHWVIDGGSRTVPEAMILDTAMRFYKRADVQVIYINVSKEWAVDRLRARRRADDKAPENLEARMKWFEDDVMPAIEYYRKNPGYTLVEVNGEQTVQEVFGELLSKISR